MRPEVQAVYDRFMAAHYGEIDIPLLCEACYGAGARAATQGLLAMSDLVPMVNRIDLRVHQVLGLLEGMLEVEA